MFLVTQLAKLKFGYRFWCALACIATYQQHRLTRNNPNAAVNQWKAPEVEEPPRTSQPTKVDMDKEGARVVRSHRGAFTQTLALGQALALVSLAST